MRHTRSPNAAVAVHDPGPSIDGRSRRALAPQPEHSAQPRTTDCARLTGKPSETTAAMSLTAAQEPRHASVHALELNILLHLGTIALDQEPHRAVRRGLGGPPPISGLV